MTDFAVDLDGLELMADRLSRIRSTLEGARKDIGGFDEDLGHAKVRGAMHHFEEHWRDGRGHVCNTAESLTTMLRESVKTIRQTDDDLTRQLNEATEGGS